MRIVISDVVDGLKKPDSNNAENFISMDVTNLKRISISAHGAGSVRVFDNGITYSGVYVTCIDNEGYPII